MRLKLGCLLALLLAVPLGVRAQDRRDDDQSKMIGQLLERISKLEKRVEDLEARPGETFIPAAEERSGNAQAASQPSKNRLSQESHLQSVPTLASGGPMRVAAKSRVDTMRLDHSSAEKVSLGSLRHDDGTLQGHELNAVQENPPGDVATGLGPTYPNLHIAGFGSVNYFATSQAHVPQSFGLGQLILHFSSALAPKVNFFSELSIKGLGPAPADVRALEIERAIIRYDFNDLAKLSFGRYHTPINYWNTAYHHGTWLQTSITRPEMIAFGGSFLPGHFVGALAEGTTPAAGLNFNYGFGVGNGRGFPFSQAGTSIDANNNKAWLGNFFIKPDRLAHLQLGGSVYRDLLSFPSSVPFAEREFIGAGHVVWNSETPEFIAEFANVHHRRTDTGAIFNSQAYYVQIAYRLPWLERSLKPYYRIEYIHTPRSDKAFAGLPNEQGSSFVGLRYDFTNFAAMKFEFDRQKRRDVAQAFKIFQFSTDFTF